MYIHMGYTFPTSVLAKKVIYLVYIASLAGVFVGGLWIYILWEKPLSNVSTYISLHPSIMFYLVLLPFIMSVAYTFLPTFWNYKARLKFALSTVALLISGEATQIILVINSIYTPYSTIASTFGAGIFALYILSRIRLNNRVYRSADLYIALSMSILLFILGYRIYYIFIYGSPLILNEYRYDHLFLTGFVVSLIIGVSVRTMKFKFTYVRDSILRYSFMLHLLGIILTILSLVLNRYMFFSLAAILFLLSTSIYGIAYKIFERYPGNEYASRMRERDWIRYRYFTRHLNMAGLWLYTSYILLIIYLTIPSILPSPDILIWDASLHSLTLGFIGNFIYAYGGIMLPPIILRRPTYRNLSYTPMIMLNIAVLLRIITDLIYIFKGSYMTLIHTSLIIASLTYFIIMLTRLFIEEVK